MANAIKQISVQRGHDVTRYTLVSFGGAGGQHACLVADALGMTTVMIHPYAGVLSAYGRSEEHTSELQSLMRISYAVFCLKKKKTAHNHITNKCRQNRSNCQQQHI